jgi:hypothetical protein
MSFHQLHDKMNLPIRLFITLFILASPAISDEPRTLRLLTIGNSFSANATRHLKPLAEAAGHTLVHNSLVVGGASLQLHADKARKNEANPKSKAGHYTDGRGLRDNLKLEKWDVVTIQQASVKSHDYATFQPHATWLRDYITQHAPQARLYIHQTWAYRADDPRFTKLSLKPREPKTQQAMYECLTAAYHQLASDLGAAGIIPVGDAFHLADTHEKWGFRPDPNFQSKAAIYPALPDQKHSLHVGWVWRESKDKKKHTLSMDGHHANLAGEYLGACVWLETLFAQNPVGNAYIPKGLEPKYDRFLQETAHNAVKARQKSK